MGTPHSLFQTVFAKYRDHGDLRRDALQCSVDRRSSWPFPRRTLAKTWRVQEVGGGDDVNFA